MSIHKLLKIGQLASIEIFDERVGKTVRYPTKVQDITTEEVYLSSPAKGKQVFRIPENTNVKIWFANQMASYSFKTKVLRNERGSIPMLVLERPENLVKVQQRLYVRVLYALDVKMTWTDSEEKQHSLTCRSRDISAGGMMLLVNKQLALPKNAVVGLEFTVNGRKIEVTGEVVKNEIERGSAGRKYTLGIKFTSLKENEKDHLVQSVFQKQIELKKKGLL